ncbi:hypothetical protein [Antarcticibacterium sp. W02-3]|nr:hypothetical protein [Antarcticibacterium sp. W02-3]
MAAAYHTTLTEKIIQLDWNENDISSELHKNIKANPFRYQWEITINVEGTIPKNIPKVKGFADKFPRIDFKLTSFRKSYEYEYFFEAKNLKQNDSKLKRRYITTGIDNFVSKKYEKGSLVGYLLEGKTDKTVNGINYLLEKDKRETEILKITSNQWFNFFYESSHPGINTLKHFILDYTRIPK